MTDENETPPPGSARAEAHTYTRDDGVLVVVAPKLTLESVAGMTSPAAEQEVDDVVRPGAGE